MARKNIWRQHCPIGKIQVLEQIQATGNNKFWNIVTTGRSSVLRAFAQVRGVDGQRSGVQWETTRTYGQSPKTEEVAFGYKSFFILFK